MAKKEEQEFQYVVARPWYPDEPDSSLCIYTYGGEIQKGTMKNAEEFLAYVKRQAKLDKDPKKDIDSYGIYVVGLTRIK